MIHAFPSRESLRPYRHPFLSVPISQKGLFHVGDMLVRLRQKVPDAKPGQISRARDKLLALLAFADAFGYGREFMQLDPRSLIYSPGADYAEGEDTYLIVPSRVNEKMENTGQSMTFRIQGKAWEHATASKVILGVVQLPRVHFIGWVAKADVPSFWQGWNIQILAGSNAVKPLPELAVHHRHQQGTYA